MDDAIPQKRLHYATQRSQSQFSQYLRRLNQHHPAFPNRRQEFLSVV
jgi:hypothetical protein